MTTPPETKIEPSDSENLIQPEPEVGIPMAIWVIGIAFLALAFGWLLV